MNESTHNTPVITEALLARLRRDEGTVKHASSPRTGAIVHAAYRCTAGKLTIGYGHNLDDRGIPDSFAQLLLLHDVRDVLASLTQFNWFLSLDRVRQQVLIEMVFQLGMTKFLTFRKMREALQTGDYARAADEMLDSKWAKSDSPARAKRAADRMRKGSSPRWLSVTMDTSRNLIEATREDGKAMTFELSGDYDAATGRAVADAILKGLNDQAALDDEGGVR